ncbi:F0F1 ATP synthase subunit delta [Acuticoccus sp.]|uniref:F0F1 ATP synthase subunit delta n=1 Tax=Acuticoccus sp. TaxID=1904378 RepID=UPI003B517C47
MTDPHTSGVAQRYASALFELARERDALEETERDAALVRRMIAESEDLRRLVKSPVFSADDQVRALGAVLASHDVAGLVANFARLVASNRRLFALPDMLDAFATLMARHRGETLAVVTSAEPLSDAQRTALEEALAQKAGGTVQLQTSVDPSLIGGLVVRLGSQMIDTSVRTRLQGLRLAMKEAA